MDHPQNIYSSETKTKNTFLAINDSFAIKMFQHKILKPNDYAVFLLMLSLRKSFNEFVYEGKFTSLITLSGIEKRSFQKAIDSLENANLINVKQLSRCSTEQTIVEFLNQDLYISKKDVDFTTTFESYMMDKILNKK